MDIWRYGENGRYRSVATVHEFGVKVLQITLVTCRHTHIDYFYSPMNARSQEKRPLAGKLFCSLCLRKLTYRNRDKAAQAGIKVAHT